MKTRFYCPACRRTIKAKAEHRMSGSLYAHCPAGHPLDDDDLAPPRFRWLRKILSPRTYLVSWYEKRNGGDWERVQKAMQDGDAWIEKHAGDVVHVDGLTASRLLLLPFHPLVWTWRHLTDWKRSEVVRAWKWWRSRWIRKLIREAGEVFDSDTPAVKAMKESGEWAKIPGEEIGKVIRIRDVLKVGKHKQKTDEAIIGPLEIEKKPRPIAGEKLWAGDFVTIDDDGKVMRSQGPPYYGSVALYTTEAGESVEILHPHNPFEIAVGPSGEEVKIGAVDSVTLPNGEYVRPKEWDSPSNLSHYAQAGRITREFFKEHLPEAIACPCGLNMTPAHFGETFKIDQPYQEFRTGIGSHRTTSMPMGSPTFRVSGCCPECKASISATWNHLGNLIQSEIKQRP